MGDSCVRIGFVLPELLGTYGDRGNARILEQRLTRRGIHAEMIELSATEPIPTSLDIYVIGGGEDHAEQTAIEILHRSNLGSVWELGAVLVGICAGFQLLGESMIFDDGIKIMGLGLIDAVTVPGDVRRIGNTIVTTNDGELGALAGFENHRGITTLGSRNQPLGTITTKDEADRAEGVLAPRIVGTYLHGPVLVANPKLADLVLSWVVGVLPPIEPGYAEQLHDDYIARAAR